MSHVSLLPHSVTPVTQQEGANLAIFALNSLTPHPPPFLAFASSWSLHSPISLPLLPFRSPAPAPSTPLSGFLTYPQVPYFLLSSRLFPRLPYIFFSLLPSVPLLYLSIWGVSDSELSFDRLSIPFHASLRYPPVVSPVFSAFAKGY
ncbi:hypothetical protein BJ508DRAFT_37899 [Ascobolus immersus RN42]|uniref:Uncharacterized protein n=1 Tax=Ascobolus immersus RN42 TaxID=1160509 RepID=A0A3N4IFL0_ASCIM|nr:hypothetical protein BJ508DRAFT_37899 [Ascobolus immersus RN42]